MGFMDKMKDAAKQAGEGASEDGRGGEGRHVAEHVRHRAGRQPDRTPGRRDEGDPEVADRASGKKLGGGTEYQMEIEVHPEGGEPYAASITQQLIEQSADHYKQNIGGEIKVKVDPADPNKMVLWG